MLKNESPRVIREVIRRGEYSGDTSGFAPGHVQANLVILKKEIAMDFLAFCQANPQPCPVIEVTSAGDPEPKMSAPGADLRTDLGSYRVFRDGQLVDECPDITAYWRDDLVAFLIGYSYSFEWILRDAGLSIRHIEENKGAPVYFTNIPLKPFGMFHGTMAVSMRPFVPKDVVRAIQITSRFPQVHGAPVHLGFPESIGIDIDKPDFGGRVTIREGELPVFWACGVTPQIVAMRSGVDFMITHSAGRMFITDLKVQDYSVI